MSTNLKTPQGQLAVTDTAIIADKNDQLRLPFDNMNLGSFSADFRWDREDLLQIALVVGVASGMGGRTGTGIPEQSQRNRGKRLYGGVREAETKGGEGREKN